MAEIRVKETGTIKLFESDNTSSVTIASPASLGADRTITLPDASVTLASGTMLATDGSGASLTALNASELGSGTVPTARLGSGTASSSTVLYGDQTYKTEPTGGKIGQVLQTTTSTYTSMASVSYSTAITQAITPVATSSKILAMCTANFGIAGGGTHTVQAKISRTTDAAGTESFPIGDIICGSGNTDYNESGRSTTHIYLDSPSETNEVTYTLVFRSSTTSSVYLNNYAAGAQNVSTLTVMEILA